MQCRFLPRNAAVLVNMLGTLACSTAGPRGDLDYLSLSAATWVVTNDNTGASSKDSYFQSAKLWAAYHIGPIKGSVGIPLAFTVERRPGQLLYAVYPGDQEMLFGFALGHFQPRLGVAFPLGYPVDDVAWIGSGNINGLVALGFKTDRVGKGSLSLGGEMLGRVALTDTADGARLGRGSISWYVSLRPELRKNAWGYGVEGFLWGAAYTYTDWGKDEQSVSFLPSLTAKRYLDSGWRISAKAGAGPGWSSREPGKGQVHATGSIAVETGL